jgi:hypothetical protein
MPKKKAGKHLKFYKDCMSTGRLPDFGLCYSLGGRLLQLFTPTIEEKFQLEDEGLCPIYWAYGVSDDFKNDEERWHSFSSLRQTIVLLMAAINNEL